MADVFSNDSGGSFVIGNAAADFATPKELVDEAIVVLRGNQPPLLVPVSKA
jgi:hypothetical protein